MQWLRGLAAATAALAAVMGLMVVTTSSAAAQGREMCITGFRVKDTEDVGADGDEPYLKVNTVFWRAPGSMDEPGGDPGSVSAVAVEETVHVGDVVQAWDADSPDDDDLIGSATVEAHGTRLTFMGDGAHYEAYYRPGRCD